MRRVAIVLGCAALLAGCVRVRWSSVSDWDGFAVVPVSNATNVVALSVGAPADEVGRITETGPEGSDRRWWIEKTEVAVDSDIVALWHGHTRWIDGGGQLGEVLREQTLPDGTTTGYVVWHDYVYGQDQIIHAGVWFTDAAQHFHFSSLGDAAFDNMKKVFPVASASRANGVTTLIVSPGNGIKVGDTLVVDVTDPTFDKIAAATAVTPTTVQYADPRPDGLLGGSGTVQNLDAVMPYWVRSRLVGSSLAIKVWAASEGEPSWSDAVHVRVFDDTARIGPTGLGRDGIQAAHIEGSDWVEYGRLEIQSLDGTSPAPIPPPTLTAAQRRADRLAARTLGPFAGLPVVASGSFP